MLKSPFSRLALGFTLCFFAVGIPFWQVPYSKVSLPDTLENASLLLVCAAALVLASFNQSHFWRIALVVSAALPAAVWARVAVETARDPTSHNLWPFEIVLAMFVGLAASIPGALLGTIFRRWRGDTVQQQGEMHR